MKNGFSLHNALKFRELSSKERQDDQLHLLKNHVSQACRSAYYQQSTSMTPNIQDINSIQDICHFPFTHRKDIESNPELFRAVPESSFSDIAFTSGSTGGSLAIPYTSRDLDRLAFNEEINFYRLGVKAGDCFLLCVTLDRCFIAGLAYYSGLVKLGATVIRSGSGQPARQWELIQRCNPKGIVGVPSFLLKIAEWGINHGHNPRKSTILKLVTIGEPIRKHDNSLTVLGRKLEEAWGADIFSSYGATELQTAFCECTENCGGHVHPELMIAEIVDPEGKVLPRGQAGEVVVTPLGVEGIPLIRFRTGDIARMYFEPCDCGWKTERLGPIEGRLAQRLKFKGTTLYPEMIYQSLEELSGVNSYYVEVGSAYDLSDDIRVVVAVEDSSLTEDYITEHLQARLRVKPKVVLEDKTEIREKMHSNKGSKIKRFFDQRRVSR